MEADLDIRLLRAFVAVAEAGTVSKAALRLSRTQAAVSMQLQRLEAEFGSQLLLRSSRGMILTEAGEIVLAYARKTIALGEDVRRQIAGRMLIGRVRLGIIEDLAMTRLPSIIADFRRRHPSVEIALTSAGGADLAKAIDEGRSDIVIADPVRFASAPSGYMSRPLVWGASRIIEIDAEAELPLVLFESACSWQDRMLASLAEAGLPWRVGCRVSTFAALVSGLRAGFGIGLMLPESLPPDCENVQGRLHLPPAPMAEFGIFVGANPPPLVNELASFLREGFADRSIDKT